MNPPVGPRSRLLVTFAALMVAAVMAPTLFAAQPSAPGSTASAPAVPAPGSTAPHPAAHVDWTAPILAPGAAAASAKSASKQPQLKVVIDPGHGGDELGAEGRKNVIEKEVTLDVGRRLKALLDKEQGIATLLTRDTDISVPLDDRTALANQFHADLFLSIHVNSAPRHDARGAETYFLASKAKDDEIRTLAAIENNAAGVERDKLPESSGNLELVLWDLAQETFLQESAELAGTIQKELNDALGVRDRGVKQAPFRVLMGATMPAVLVEIGFISNPVEEESLSHGEYRDKIADALLRAVQAFRASPRGRRLVPPTPTR
jgi:N-acetylmuramoyl-L-alanine amidase